MDRQDICGQCLPCLSRDVLWRCRLLLSHWGLAAGSPRTSSPRAPQPQWAALARSLVPRRAVSEVVSSSVCPGNVGAALLPPLSPGIAWLQLLSSWIWSLQQCTATIQEPQLAVSPWKPSHAFHPSHTGIWGRGRAPRVLPESRRTCFCGQRGGVCYKGLYDTPTQPAIPVLGKCTRF